MLTGARIDSNFDGYIVTYQESFVPIWFEGQVEGRAALHSRVWQSMRALRAVTALVLIQL